MTAPRFIAASLIAPAAPVLLVVALCLPMRLSEIPFLALAVGVVTYGHAALLGVPVAWFLARKNALTLWRVVGAAFLVGAMPIGASNLYQDVVVVPGFSSGGVGIQDRERMASAIRTAAIVGTLQCGLLGAASGFIWWLIAKPRSRPRG
jgi:hypothetical protein